MKYLRCSFPDLMALPVDYIKVIEKEVTREKRAADQAKKSKGRR
jgi:hypothetical protein